MTKLYDEDGIDGPFERAMRALPRTPRRPRSASACYACDGAVVGKAERLTIGATGAIERVEHIPACAMHAWRPDDMKPATKGGRS